MRNVAAHGERASQMFVPYRSHMHDWHKIAKDVGFHSLPMDRSTIGEASFRRAMLQPSLERRTDLTSDG
jgi:hypothetical protein